MKIIDESFFEKDLEKILKKIQSPAVLRKILANKKLSPLPKKWLLQITWVSDAQMLKLNAKYRNKPKTTDILSFPAPLVFQKMGHLGELIISRGALKRQATQWQHSIRDEARILVVHGLVHLLGHDHEKNHKAWVSQVQAEAILFKALGWKLTGLADRVSG